MDVISGMLSVRWEYTLATDIDTQFNSPPTCLFGKRNPENPEEAHADMWSGGDCIEGHIMKIWEHIWVSRVPENPQTLK